MGRVIPLTILKNKGLNGPTKLAISNKRNIEVVTVKQILYFKADGNYTEIHMIDGSCHLASLTLKKYAEYVPKDLFLRVHQSYLIQRQLIKRVALTDNAIILENDRIIPFSRKHKRSLMQYVKAMLP